MISHSFRKTIFISLLGHITLFGIFTLSFGNRLPKADYTRISFWGQFLQNSQVSQPIPESGITPTPIGISLGYNQLVWGFTRKPDTAALDKLARQSQLLPVFYGVGKHKNTFLTTENRIEVIAKRFSCLKPPLTLPVNLEKVVFNKESSHPSFYFKRRQPVIVFHPILPYSFTLYFKDRQVAHVELMFKAASLGLRNSILIKRKISSGNLEVDLLALRYIGHYLFIQHPSILTNNWQIVKIDLSAKEN